MHAVNLNESIFVLFDKHRVGNFYKYIAVREIEFYFEEKDRIVLREKNIIPCPIEFLARLIIGLDERIYMCLGLRILSFFALSSGLSLRGSFSKQRFSILFFDIFSSGEFPVNYYNKHRFLFIYRYISRTSFYELPIRWESFF